MNDFELDLETLVTKNEYGHLLKLEDNLLDLKLTILEVIDGCYDNKKNTEISGHDSSQVILEIASAMNDLDCVNKNIDTVKLALQFKEKKTMEFLDTGTYYKN